MRDGDDAFEYIERNNLERLGNAAGSLFALGQRVTSRRPGTSLVL